MRKVKCFFGAVRSAWGDTVFKIWVFVSVVMIAVGLFVVEMPLFEVAILLGLACVGLGSEMVNASIESLMDVVHPSHSPAVKVVKDAFGAASAFVFSGFFVAFLVFAAQKLGVGG